jgi:hypothetical protein
MTKEQAINIINQALAQVQTTRQGHETLMKALEILTKVEDDISKT